jgi:hypothetical protein
MPPVRRAHLSIWVNLWFNLVAFLYQESVCTPGNHAIMVSQKEWERVKNVNC